jgi:glucose-6-phosphate isomerase
MLPVLMDKKAKCRDEFYYMYRDCAAEKSRKIFHKYGLRYDITAIPAFKCGREFNKTFGHFHSNAKGAKITYPEIYEVLQGTAIYLLQNDWEFIAVRAKKGDKVLVPPGYGHVTINPSKKEMLVMANIMARASKSDYGNYKKKRGAMYYFTAKGYVRNKKYGKVPKIKFKKTKNNARFGLTKNTIYREFLLHPKRFEWLVKPQKYDFIDFL